MASADWQAASHLQARLPHTYTAMEHLIMAMADAHNNRGKTTFFGRDKGLKSHLKFEEKFRDALIALTLDGLVKRSDRAEVFRQNILLVLDAWESIFPNWPDAHQFAHQQFRTDQSAANGLIANLIGAKL